MFHCHVKGRLEERVRFLNRHFFPISIPSDFHASLRRLWPYLSFLVYPFIILLLHNVVCGSDRFLVAQSSLPSILMKVIRSLKDYNDTT